MQKPTTMITVWSMMWKGSGFARFHRGRLVRRAAIRRIETDRSGDFPVALEGGATLRGSRRFRPGLQWPV